MYSARRTLGTPALGVIASAPPCRVLPVATSLHATLTAPAPAPALAPAARPLAAPAVVTSILGAAAGVVIMAGALTPMVLFLSVASPTFRFRPLALVVPAYIFTPSSTGAAMRLVLMVVSTPRPTTFEIAR